MSLTSYFKLSFARKMARRITREYPIRVDSFQLADGRKIEFANWLNPLVIPKTINDHELAFFSRYIRPGDLIIDIGANIGNLTITMALAAGKTGTVLAFDPNPYVYKILEYNAGLNKSHTNVVPHNIAITHKSGQFRYASSEASFNNGGVLTDEARSHGRFALPVKIDGKRLDEFLLNSPYKDQRVNLVKIDTEGYDSTILDSITEILEKYQPVVIAECFRHLPSAERMSMHDLFRNLGYAVYNIGEMFESGEKTLISRREDMNRWEHFDILAIPEGHLLA